MFVNTHYTYQTIFVGVLVLVVTCKSFIVHTIMSYEAESYTVTNDVAHDTFPAYYSMINVCVQHQLTNNNS